jgi:DHA3 family tetracycline resistance protein-like MFS transporter
MVRSIDSERFYLGSRVWYAICWSCMITVNLVFMVQVAGLDPLQMVLVGTVLELSVFVFEIPTGVVADVVSRRLSVIIGHAIMGLGFGMIVIWPSFEMILVSQVIWGFGYTFISGAYAAWLTSELGVERANATFLRGSQLGHLAAFFGILAAVALAHLSLALPIAIGSAGLVLLAAAMALCMREDNFTPALGADRDSFGAMAVTFKAGVGEIQGRPVLWLMFLITMVYGMFSEGIDRLFTPYLLEDFAFPELGPLQPVTWWGIIAAISSLLGYASTSFARRRVKLEDGPTLTRALSGALLAISLLVLLLANVSGFVAVLVCYWLIGALRSVYGPLMTAWLNRLLPEASRATLFSMFGQADALGQTFGGPVIGALAKMLSISFALGVSGLSLLPTLPLFRRLAGDLSSDVGPRNGADSGSS